MPGLPVTRDDTFINKLGSGYLWGTEVKIDGSALATPDTIHAFGRINKSMFKKTVAQSKDKDEAGIEIVTGATTSTTFDYTMMQRKKTDMDLPEAMEGRYTRFLKELSGKKLGPTADQLQYLIIAAAVIEPTVDLDGSDMYSKHHFTCYPATADITVTATVVGTFGSQAISGTIPAGRYHVVVEMTAA